MNRSDADSAPDLGLAVQALAESLNRAYGTGAQVDADGVLHLAMQDGTPLAVCPSPDGRSMVFYASLAQLGGAADVALMIAALGLNLHQEATRGGAIGLDAASQSLVYSWRLECATQDVEGLPQLLEDFCNTSATLLAALAQARQDFSPDEHRAMGQQSGGAANQSGAPAGPVDLADLRWAPIRG
jgi:hypothetical protein